MIETFFNPQIIEQIWPIVLAGLANTILLSLIVVPLGFVGGLMLALLATVHHPAVRWPLMAWVDFFRAFPPLVLLLFIYGGHKVWPKTIEVELRWHDLGDLFPLAQDMKATFTFDHAAVLAAYWSAGQKLAHTIGDVRDRILGDLAASGLGVQGMSWVTSPACTEVETLMMDWMQELLGLPEKFRSTSATGGGVIRTVSGGAATTGVGASGTGTGAGAGAAGTSTRGKRIVFPITVPHPAHRTPCRTAYARIVHYHAQTHRHSGSCKLSW